MITADTPAGRVLARSASRDDGPFMCPACAAPVIIKKGEIVSHHFAHARHSDCDYGAGETELHRNVKEAVYDSIAGHPLCRRVQLEAAVGGNRADVLVETAEFGVYPGGEVQSPSTVAIEIQRSNLPVSELDARTDKYSQSGVKVIWVVAEPESILDNPYRSTVRTRDWHRWIHDIMGRVYVWRFAGMFAVVRLDDVTRFDDFGPYELVTKKRAAVEGQVHITNLVFDYD